MQLRAQLARLGGPELGTLEYSRVMREINARTDIGGSRWSVPGLLDLLTCTPRDCYITRAWKETTHRPPAQRHPILPAKFNA